MIAFFHHLNIDMLIDNEYISRIVIFLAALLLSLIFAKLSLQFAHAIGLVDIPLSEPHKTHKAPTPIAGGLVISLTLLTLISFSHFSGFYQIDYYLVAAFIIIFIVGILDDMINLSAKIKLLGQFAASLVLILGGYNVSILNSDILNIIISILWFVGILNAFNFIDSADGLLLGVCIIIDSVIFFATFNSNQEGLNLLSIGILGLLVSLYSINKKPARLFLGDSGSLLLGLMFAIIVLRFNPLGFDRTTSWISPILIMSFPIFDTSLVVFSRFRKHVPIYRGALDHTFHRFQRYCKNQNTPYVLIYGITIFSNLLAMVNLFLPPVISFALFGIVLASGALLIILFEKFLSVENHY